MVAPLELMRMRLLVFLWDKMHMKMVMLLRRCVTPPCVPGLKFLRECCILVHCLILLISESFDKFDLQTFCCMFRPAYIFISIK